MQLNGNLPNLRKQLALACGALLSNVAAAQPGEQITVDAGTVYYTEGAGRVQVVEPIVNVMVPLSDVDKFNLKLVYDSLTGGTPNGALPAKGAQTFSTTSGLRNGAANGAVSAKSYSAAAGVLPLDPYFTKNRKSAAGEWARDLDDVDHLSLGGAYSDERDFKSATLDSVFSRDFNSKNTTFSLGVNAERDRILPVSNTPLPLSGYTDGITEGNQRKTEADLLIGLTQVMDRRWITQLNYAIGRETGYLTDPYKIVSQIRTTLCEGAFIIHTPGLGGGPPIGLPHCGFNYIFEGRPDHRHRNSLYWENRYAFDADSVAISYRYSWDDWRVNSHTIDLRYRAVFNETLYIEPQAHLYHQSAASFFRYFVLQSDPAPDFVSADERLARFNAVTAGGKFGWRFADDQEISLRAERYGRWAMDGNKNLPTQLQGLNINPVLRAWVVQLGIDFAV